MSDFTDSMIEAGFWDPEEYMDYLDEKCSDTYEQDFEDAQYDWRMSVTMMRTPPGKKTASNEASKSAPSFKSC